MTTRGRAWAGSSWGSWRSGPRRPDRAAAGHRQPQQHRDAAPARALRVGARRARRRVLDGLPGDLRDGRDAGLACGRHRTTGPVCIEGADVPKKALLPRLFCTRLAQSAFSRAENRKVRCKSMGIRAISRNKSETVV